MLSYPGCNRQTIVIANTSRCHAPRLDTKEQSEGAGGHGNDDGGPDIGNPAHDDDELR